MTRAVYLVASAAPLARWLPTAARVAREHAWTPVVIGTPSADRWLDTEALGRDDVPVRTEFRGPDETKTIPPADAVVFAPATFTSVNKAAAGIADNYALGVICEALATASPTVVVPFVSTRFSGHPAWQRSLATLTEAGAAIVHPRTGRLGDLDPLPEGGGERHAAEFDWAWPFEHLHDRTDERP